MAEQFFGDDSLIVKRGGMLCFLGEFGDEPGKRLGSESLVVIFLEQHCSHILKQCSIGLCCREYRLEPRARCRQRWLTSRSLGIRRGRKRERSRGARGGD